MAADVRSDPRWPHLTLDAVRALLPERHHAEVSRVRALPRYRASGTTAVW
jgi:hypothetical protein